MDTFVFDYIAQINETMYCVDAKYFFFKLNSQTPVMETKLDFYVKKPVMDMTPVSQ